MCVCVCAFIFFHLFIYLYKCVCVCALRTVKLYTRCVRVSSPSSPPPAIYMPAEFDFSTSAHAPPRKLWTFFFFFRFCLFSLRRSGARQHTMA